ncbi:ZIP family metal transporter [Tepidibacter formicigenes]|jgi:ZIP family zinc transporter|uniref:Zinc transporter, ZIP family n=1 Tax=Tepidibacter formicigenes DSM 15518 TaxID=1123349 RepID=A0A1M6NVB1_9FIRM|nr:hypothetical protein [Tepidibacter formicigenes]SHJ99605.1 zinc transporter, ZIP family [Tepidibacter formicigenes DSM 15518]
MLGAMFWGGITGFAVFLGALVGIYFKIKKYIVGFIMALGTGVLIGAASFELLIKSVKNAGIKITAIGFILGAIIFTILDFIIAQKGGNERKRSKEKPEGYSGLAIFIGTLMDAIPESLIIGVSLIKEYHVSWILVIAIFISNFPEGLSSTIGLKKDGYSNSKIFFLWLMVLVTSSLSSLIGFIFFENASKSLVNGIGSFAAGGIVAMVSSTMMPEAYKEGGSVVGFISAIGLLSALILSHFE